MRLSSSSTFSDNSSPYGTGFTSYIGDKTHPSLGKNKCMITQMVIRVGYCHVKYKPCTSSISPHPVFSPG